MACGMLAFHACPRFSMAPLPPPEPSRHLDTLAFLDARKIRFELNRYQLPTGLEATFGVIRHP